MQQSRFEHNSVIVWKLQQKTIGLPSGHIPGLGKVANHPALFLPRLPDRGATKNWLIHPLLAQAAQSKPIDVLVKQVDAAEMDEM